MVRFILGLLIIAGQAQAQASGSQPAVRSSSQAQVPNSPARADDIPANFEIRDAKYGTIKVYVHDLSLDHQDLDDDQPLRLFVSVECNGAKGRTREGRRLIQQVLNGAKICEWGKHTFDANRILTLHYKTVEDAVKDRHCDAEWQQQFDLKLICPQ